MTAYHNWTHRPRSRGGTDPLEFGGHGPWIEPTLVNGYTDTTASPDTFAYRHAPGSPDDAWELEFRGHIEGASGLYAFVLPTEDRPASDKYGVAEGEDSDTGDGIVVEWYIEQATGFVFFTFPIGGTGGGGGGTAADDVTVDSTSLVGTGTDAQTVFEELDDAIANHLADTSAAHAASAISADSTTLVGTGTDVQAVLEELDNGIADHLADTSDAHDATAISFSPAGTIAATDVQAAIEEVAAEAGGGGGALTQIFDSVLGSAAASFDVTSISGAYAHLRIVLDARGTQSATSVTVYCRFNNDSGSNYDYQWLYAASGSTTIAGLEGRAQAQILLGDIAAASATAGRSGTVDASVANYAGTTFDKNIRANAGFVRGTAAGDIFVENVIGVWRSTSAITRVTLSLSAGNFDTGSRLTIYGLS